MRFEPRRITLLARSPEIAAALGGVAVALLVAFFLHQFAGGGGATRARPATPPSAAHDVRLSVTTPRPAAAPVSAARIVRVATADLVELGDSAATTSDRVRQIVDEVTVGPLHTRAVQAMPLVVAQIHARLVKSNAPSEFKELPLGYRVGTLGHAEADVSIWHVDVAASSALPLVSATYTTTTYRLRPAGGTWLIESIHNVSGPTPPGPRASALAIDAFARAASAFSSYHYVP